MVDDDLVVVTFASPEQEAEQAALPQLAHLTHAAEVLAEPRVMLLTAAVLLAGLG